MSMLGQTNENRVSEATIQWMEFNAAEAPMSWKIPETPGKFPSIKYLWVLTIRLHHLISYQTFLCIVIFHSLELFLSLAICTAKAAWNFQTRSLWFLKRDTGGWKSFIPEISIRKWNCSSCPFAGIIKGLGTNTEVRRAGCRGVSLPRSHPCCAQDEVDQKCLMVSASLNASHFSCLPLRKLPF